MLKTLVFGSGGGSNFKAIFKTIKHENVPVDITCVISNNSKSGILAFSKENGLNTFHLSRFNYSSIDEYENEYHKLLETFKPDLILLAGYMKMIPVSVINRMAFKIINIHPSLLPSFGGEGMYGMNVHSAVKNAGVKITGATVHFVTENYDEGPIILQDSVKLYGTESVEEIAEKVLNTEHKLYSEALKIIVTNKYKIVNNQVVILEQENT